MQNLQQWPMTTCLIFYLHLNMIDSANHTRKLALSKLDLVSDECKSYILANLAFSFSEHTDKM